MADTGGPARVKKMREARKNRGFTETNVWIPNHVKEAIERKVALGVFPTRRLAITVALQRVFCDEELDTATAKSPQSLEL